jgi:hypothetical protein
VIAPGLLADLVAVDLGDPSLHPRTDTLNSVVYAMSDRAVTDVWVHGRRVVESGRLVTVDERELLARVRELTQDWCVPETAQCAPQGRPGAGARRPEASDPTSPHRPRRDDEP